VANTDEERIKLAAKVHLQTIMRLAGDPLLPYSIIETRCEHCLLFLVNDNAGKRTNCLILK